MARAYSVFATGGRELRLRSETLQALTRREGAACSGRSERTCPNCNRSRLKKPSEYRTSPFMHASFIETRRRGTPIRQPGSDTPMSPTEWARH
jgi:hypothetical protein